MEIKIGVYESHKELVVQVEDDTDTIVDQIEKAVAKGEAIFWVTDRKGRRIGIPANKVAYVEITPDSDRTVGFGR